MNFGERKVGIWLYRAADGKTALSFTGDGKAFAIGGEGGEVSLADLRRFRDDLTALLGEAEVTPPCQHPRVFGLIGMDASRCEDCGATLPRQPSPSQRYAVGDRVWWHLSYAVKPYTEIRIVVEVRAELSYRLNGGETWVPEGQLAPFPVPVVCAPDGTRCDSWRANQGTLSYSRNYCPDCGGTLR